MDVRVVGAMMRQAALPAGRPMRWILAAFTALMVLVCFATKSPGLLGLCLFLGLVGLIATGLAFAQERIEGNAKPEVLNAFEMKKLRESMTKPPPEKP